MITSRLAFPLDMDEMLATWQPEGQILLIDSPFGQQRSNVTSTRLNTKFGDTVDRFSIYTGSSLDSESISFQHPHLTIPVTSTNSLMQIYEKVCAKINEHSKCTVVLDATVLPSHITMALCQMIALSPYDTQPSLAEFIVAYTLPEMYAPALGGGFTECEYLRPFSSGNTDPDDDREIGWIPIVGFSSMPTEYSLNFVCREEQKRLSDDIDLNTIRQTMVRHNTYPIVGWPPYRPDFFSRALWENELLFGLLESNLHKVQYAAASDPFEIAMIIETIVESRSDLRFICSAHGSKPMNVGCALACSKLGVPIIYSFARSSYSDPETSGNPGKTLMFWIYSREQTDSDQTN